MNAISIAMATYNGELFLEKQLVSIVEQSVQPSEIVICDDGSTDKTIEIIKAFAEKTQVSVRLFENPQRLGYRKNFMKAASLCTGDLIAFSDQDDIWHREKLERCEATLTPDEVLLCYHSAGVIDENDAPIGRHDPFPRDQPVIDFLGMPHEWFSSTGFTQVFKRQLLAFDALWPSTVDHNCPHEPLAHDQWYFLVAGILGKIGYISEDLALYRQHRNNVDGWAGKRSTLRRALGLTPYFDGYRSHVAAALSRSATAAEIEKQASGVGPKQRFSVSKTYSRLGQFYEMRTAIYSGKPALDRASALFKLVASGGYKSFAAGGLGRLALMRDLVFAMPFSKKITHLIL